MDRTKIEERKEKVLDAVVGLFINSALPVGSRAVADEMGLSSATVRNIMSELEREGLIHQPHTSAGRVPTEKGYRFYVDFLMKPEHISSKEKRHIEIIHELGTRCLEDIVEESSHILSQVSSLAAVVMFPKDEEEGLYFGGAHHILEQPEFRYSDTISNLFKAMEEKDVFLDIFKEDLGTERPKIRIGSENRCRVLNNCSTITASYKIRKDTAGSIGILGPTRMEYGRLVSLVGYLAGAMSEFLDRTE